MNIKQAVNIHLVSYKKRKGFGYEGKDGTKRCCENVKSKINNGVLLLPKKQDLRIDLPTIGFQTLKQCKAIGLKGIAVKSHQNIFLDRNRCISFANKNKCLLL